MLRRTTCSLWILATFASVSHAQHGAGGAAPAARPPAEAAQFDFLLGQWELVVRLPGPGGLAERIHGAPKLLGSWKAWRAFDGWGIEDELRLVDESANPRALSHTMRIYDPAARRWSSAALDVYRARFSQGTGEWKAGELRLEGRSSDPDGPPVLTRSRFYDIRPASFRFQQDRSRDDGRTWQQGTLRIEAKRVGDPSGAGRPRDGR